MSAVYGLGISLADVILEMDALGMLCIAALASERILARGIAVLWWLAPDAQPAINKLRKSAPSQNQVLFFVNMEAV